MTDAAKAPNGEHKVESPTSVYAVASTAPQMSMGRWVKDSDLEAQTKQHSKTTWATFFTFFYASIGVIYGDIGTSPLYTMASIFANFTPNEEEILGATCLILWGLTTIVMVKYCLFIMMLDDNGEGGTFALYSLIARFANISPGNTQTPDVNDEQLTRYSRVAGLKKRSRAGPALRAWFQRSRFGQLCILFLALLGTSLVLGDAVLTPAQSVLGAVGGLQYKTSITQGGVVGVSCAIVVLLFGVNPFGSAKIGACYAPIVLLWFLFNIITAIYNIHNFYPGVFKAFSPYYGYLYFKNLRHTGWRSLAGVFLAFTGAEATFADIGHFGKNSVRFSFAFVAYPALMLTYLGQAAWMVKHIDQISVTFFASIPFGNGFYWVFFLIAMLAACVASQAMISGAFQIIKQSINLGCFPRLTVKNVSKTMSGSVYIAEANWLMMILTIVCICIFKTTTILGNAYGLCVSAMMFITTILASLAFLMAFDTPVLFVIPFFIFFGFIDCVFLSSNLFKIPTGGWFAVAIAGGVFIFSALWWWGTAKKGIYLRDNKLKLEDLLEAPEHPGKNSDDGSAMLRVASTGQTVTRVPGIALMYTETVLGAPPLLPNLLHAWGALHKNVVFVTVRRVLIPSVHPEERLLFSHTTLPGVYRAVIRYGYMDAIHHDDVFVQKLTQQIMGSVHERSTRGALPESVESAVDGLLSRPPLFILSRASLASIPTNNPVTTFIRKIFLEDVYGTMTRFAKQSSDEWGLDPAKCFEVKQVFRV